MTGREVIREIERRGGRKVRQVGSHARFTCPDGAHHVTVAVHPGRDIPSGTLRAIEKAFEPCPSFGTGWLR